MGSECENAEEYLTRLHDVRLTSCPSRLRVCAYTTNMALTSDPHCLPKCPSIQRIITNWKLSHNRLRWCEALPLKPATLASAS